MQVSRITNRLIESKTKLDKLALDGERTITSRAVDQKGLYIRLGSLSPKTHRLGVHSIYCHLKTGRKHRVAKLSQIYTRTDDALPGQVSLKDAEATAARWREQGAPDNASVSIPPVDSTNGSAEKLSLQFCYERWCKADARRRSRPKSEKYLKEAERKWKSQTPDAWKDRAILDITLAEIREHAEKLRDGEWKSQTSGKKIESRVSARYWLTMMSSIFSETSDYHEGEFNRFAKVAEKFPKGKGGHRALTDGEIRAVLNIERAHCQSATGKPNPHLWLRVLALKLCLLSGFRRSALADLKVDEINGSAIERETADKTYNEHKLPIPTQMREILDEALAIKKGLDPEVADNSDWQPIFDSEYLFCTTDGRRYSNERELLRFALKRVIEEFELPMVKGKKQSEAKHFTAHCCRYTIETVAHRLGINSKPILNHAEKKDMSDVYRDLSEEDQERAFKRVAEDHQRIVDHLFEIAAS